MPHGRENTVLKNAYINTYVKNFNYNFFFSSATTNLDGGEYGRDVIRWAPAVLEDV